LLEAAGYHVIRFWNNDVLENIDGVLQVIAQVLKSEPTPQSPPASGRGS
jgi:very-short-patch-repair endonuclease